MRWFKISPGQLYWIAYVGCCAIAVGSTAFFYQDHYDPDAVEWVFLIQFALLGFTITGLFPESNEATAVLNRGQVITTVLLSMAINIGCCSILYLSAGIIETASGENTYSFRDALYFSIVTFTTLGYGDLQPIPSARLLAAFQAFCGYVYLGLVIGLAVNGFRPPKGRKVD